MTPGARIQAAVEVLEAMAASHRPAAEALQDWGPAHRFAGSSDRAAIGNLVFDVLRRRRSLAARMGSETPRALALGAVRFHWGLAVEDLSGLLGGPHGPQALSEAERQTLAAPPADLPAGVAGDIPEWLESAFERAFGTGAAEEGSALARRAPLDLRANTLKTTRDKLLKALARFRPEPTPLSPLGVRIAPPAAAGRMPNVEAETLHGRGHFEVQDEGSQLAALLADARPGQQVVDLCAGSGGKTLALAAAMQNKGQLYASDTDKHRLRPIFERLQRAGAHNIQVIGAHERERLAALEQRADLVVIDAPCSGTGAWRRHPDAKWRLTPQALDRRLAEQCAALAEAAPLARPGGRIAYITCSVLPQENGDQVAAFLAARPEFRPVPYADAWRRALGSEPPASADGATGSLLLTPARHGTDGFFIALLERRPE